MAKLRDLIRWVPRGADLLNVLQWLFPPLAAAITAFQASVENAPPHLILLYSAVVLSLLTLAIAAVHYVVRHRAVFERLRYVRTEPVFIHPNPAQNTIGVMFKCNLMNMSQTRSLYVALRRGDLHLQGRTNPTPALKSDVVIVPPFSDFAISIAAVPGINVAQPIKGKLEVEIVYGPSPDDLKFLLAYEFEPTLDVTDLTEKGAQVVFTGPLKRYQHKRA